MERKSSRRPEPPEAVLKKPEVKEYCAEEGIARAVSEIRRLLESQKYVVVVLFQAPRLMLVKRI